MNELYSDIIKLPRRKLSHRKKMSLQDRAAQFAPYAALSGYAEAVGETERLTEKRIELDEYEIEKIDNLLREIEYFRAESPVEITYFVPDERKSGGKYVKITDVIKKFDRIDGLIYTLNGHEIPMQAILAVNI